MLEIPGFAHFHLTERICKLSSYETGGVPKSEKHKKRRRSSKLIQETHHGYRYILRDISSFFCSLSNLCGPALCGEMQQNLTSVEEGLG